jgi:hypothetical protein
VVVSESRMPDQYTTGLSPLRWKGLRWRPRALPWSPPGAASEIAVAKLGHDEIEDLGVLTSRERFWKKCDQRIGV